MKQIGAKVLYCDECGKKHWFKKVVNDEGETFFESPNKKKCNCKIRHFVENENNKCNDSME